MTEISEHDQNVDNDQRKHGELDRKYKKITTMKNINV